MGNSESADLSPEEIKELASKSAFSKDEVGSLAENLRDQLGPDKNDLTLEEFKEFFAIRLGEGPMVTALFKMFDLDNSGTLDFKEMILAFSMVEKGTPEQKLKMMFKMYDGDDSGTITRDECELIIRQIVYTAKAAGKDPKQADYDANIVLHALDENKDGIISEDEWVRCGLTNPMFQALLEID